MENKEIVESKLAEALEAAIKNMQKEGLLENVNAFDLDFTGKEIAVKFNESSDESIYDAHEEYEKEMTKNKEDADNQENFTFDEGSVKLTTVQESEKIEEMGLRTKHEDKDINPYATTKDVEYMHPENRWCEFLAAAYYWPKRNGGALLKMGDYQRYVGWENPRQDARYFEWLEKAGYLTRTLVPGNRAYSYEVTPLGEKVVRYMIRSFGERAVNPFETIKGDRMERHNLDPSLTWKKDQAFKGEVAFAYQGKNDAAPRERIVVPEAVYDRDIDVGTQRRIFGYDTGSMDERMVRQLKRIFADTNRELKSALGVPSDLKGIRYSQIILDTLDDEQKEIYKKIINKAKGQIAALGADKYYRNFMLERGGKVTPVSRGLAKSGNLNKDDTTFHDINRRSNYVEESIDQKKTLNESSIEKVFEVFPDGGYNGAYVVYTNDPEEPFSEDEEDGVIITDEKTAVEAFYEWIKRREDDSMQSTLQNDAETALNELLSTGKTILRFIDKEDTEFKDNIELNDVNTLKNELF